MIEKKEKVKDIYIDNANFAKEYDIWKQELLECRRLGKSDPQITNYLAECILKICTRMTYMPCFYNYTNNWKDSMISNAVENCIRYFDRFDKDAISKRTGKKTAGPFAYFTMISYNAFLRTIKAENHQINIKKKVVKELTPTISDILGTDGEEVSNEYLVYLQSLLDENFQDYDDKMMHKKNSQKDVDNYEEDGTIDFVEDVGDDLAESDSQYFDEEFEE